MERSIQLATQENLKEIDYGKVFDVIDSINSGLDILNLSFFLSHI
jgi:hypothetical protein